MDKKLAKVNSEIIQIAKNIETESDVFYDKIREISLKEYENRFERNLKNPLIETIVFNRRKKIGWLLKYIAIEDTENPLNVYRDALIEPKVHNYSSYSDIDSYWTNAKSSDFFGIQNSQKLSLPQLLGQV